MFTLIGLKILKNFGDDSVANPRGFLEFMVTLDIFCCVSTIACIIKLIFFKGSF